MTTAINTFLFSTRSFLGYTWSILLCILVILAGLTVYTNFAKMHFLNTDYPNWKYQQDFLESPGGEHNDFIVLGDSKGRAGYDPLVATDTVSRNMSLGGGSTIEAYHTLKKYLERNSTDSVILTIAPYHLVKLNVFWGRTIKFQYLTAEELQQVLSQDAALEQPFFSPVALPMLRYYSNYLPFAYRAELRNAFLQGRYAQNKAIYDSKARHRGLYFQSQNERSEGLSFDTNHEKIIPVPLVDLYMQKITKLADENGIRVYWYTSPLNTPSCNALHKGYQITFDAYLDSLESRFGLGVLNGRNCIDPDYFGDRGHMNRRGATLNSKKIVELWRQAERQR
jgi:hypothetical protein